MLFPGRSWKAMRWWRLSNPLAPQLHERIWHVLNAEYHRSVVHEYIAQRASRYRGHWHCWPRALLILQTDLVLLKELLTSRGAFLEPRRSRWWASGKCCLMLNDPCWGSFCSILQHFGRFCKWKLGWSQWPHKVIVDCGTLEFEDGEQDNVEGWIINQYDSSMKSAWYRSQLSAKDAGEIKESKNPGACRELECNVYDLLNGWMTPRFVALCLLCAQGGVDLTLRNEMIERVGEPRRP